MKDFVNSRRIPDGPRSAAVTGALAAASALLFAFVVWLDTIIIGFDILAENSAPDGSSMFLVRGVILAVAAGLLFAAIARQSCGNGFEPGVEPAWYERDSCWAGVVLAAVCTLVFMVDPPAFHRHALEGHLAQQASAVLFFAAAFCFLRLFVRLLRSSAPQGKLLIMATIGFAGLCLFLGLEEVDWLQSVFRYKTPAAIRELSDRNAFNLHNMNTALSHVSYYFGAFLAFVAVPFIHERTRLFAGRRTLSLLIPTRTATLIIAPAYAFNYPLWNLTFTQYAFWFTLLVVCCYTWGAWTKPRSAWPERVFLPSLLVVYLLSQAVYLYFGDRFVRPWNTTEYKELFIPFAVFVYALLTARRVRLTRGLSAPPRASASFVPVLGTIVALVCIAAFDSAFDNNVSKSELENLPFAKQYADPDYLPGEWFLNIHGTPRTPFHVVMYPLTKNFSLVTVSIVGRLITYLLVCTGIALIARRLGLTTLCACVAVGVYLLLDQNFLSGNADKILRRVESATLAYGLLCLGVYGLVIRKVWLAAIFAGLATSMHVSVGGWGTAALGLTVLSLNMGSRRERLAGLVCWCAAGSAGLYYALSFLAQSPMLDHTGDVLDADLINVYFRNPHNVLASTWSIKSYILPLIPLMLWMLVRAGGLLPDRRTALVVSRFALWTLLPYVCGLLVTPFSFAPKFLGLYPFRVATTTVAMFGLLVTTAVVSRHVFRPRARQWVAGALVAIFFIIGADRFTKDMKNLRTFPEGALRSTRHETAARYGVCRWIRDNTEPGALLLASPADRDVSYLTRRPVVVRFQNIPFDKANIIEWYRRLVDFNDGRGPKYVGWKGVEEIAHTFQAMKADQYRKLADKYGAKYLLVRARRKLDLPRLYTNGSYDVYLLADEK